VIRGWNEIEKLKRSTVKSSHLRATVDSEGSKLSSTSSSSATTSEEKSFTAISENEDTPENRAKSAEDMESQDYHNEGEDVEVRQIDHLILAIHG